MNARAACAVRHAGGFERRHRPGLGLALGGLLLTGLASAQTAVERHVVAGGGSSSGGVYLIRGSIGQADAEPLQPSTGGIYAITGGFWAGTAVAGEPFAGCNDDGSCVFFDGFEAVEP